MTLEGRLKQLLAAFDRPDFAMLAAQVPPDDELPLMESFKTRVDQQRLRNPQQALQTAMVMAAVAARLSLPEAEALSLWARGNCLYSLCRYQDALQCYQQAETHYRQLDQPLAGVRLQVNQVAVLNEMGQQQAALQLAEAARQAGEAIGEPARRYLALLAMNAGWLYHKQGELERALQTYLAGRKIFVALDDVVETARVDVNRAIVLEDMDRFTAAERLLAQARLVLVRHEYGHEVARVDLNLGALAYRRGRYQDALGHLEAAHTGFTVASNPVEAAVVSLYRALVYRDLNLLQETITLAAQAEAIFKQQRMRWQRALALVNQGIGYQRLGMLAVAEDVLNRARRILKSQGAEATVLRLDVDRAQLALDQGDVRRARRIALRLAAQLEPRQTPFAAASVQLVLAHCVLQTEPPRYAVAHQHAEMALSLATQFNLPETRLLAHHLLAQTLAQQEHLAVAQKHYQAAIQLLDTMRTWLNLDEFQLGFLADKQRIYEDALHFSHHFESPSRLLLALNELYTAPLPQVDAGSQPLTAADAAAEEERNALRAERQTLREAWHWFQRRLDAPEDWYAEEPSNLPPDMVADVRGRLRELEAQISDLTRRLRLPLATPATMSAAAPPLDLARDNATVFASSIQARLPAQTGLLLYYAVDGQLHGMLVTADTLILLPNLAPTQQLDRWLQAWRFHLEYHQQLGRQAPRTQRRTQTYLQRLHAMMIAPLAEALQGCTRLFVVMPPDWHDIPLAAAFDGNHYLVERQQLIYLSAPEVLLQNHDEALSRVRKGGSALVIGHSNGQRLPYTLDEAQQVGQALPAVYQPSLLLEEQATLTAFRFHSRQCALLHLAAHAVFRPDNPAFSWVQLADANLTVADLQMMQFPHRPLVVLSACETGRGRPQGGGLLGMARGFLVAGAAGLVVSLWKLADQPSAQLMHGFYAALPSQQRADDFAAALQVAQQAAIARQQHPFDWAGFVFIQA